MQVTDRNEQVYRARIQLDDDNRILPSSFTVQGKGISVHLGMNRNLETICKYIFAKVPNSEGKPVALLNVGEVLDIPLEIHNKNEDNSPHVDITGVNAIKQVSNLESSKLASISSLVDYNSNDTTPTTTD